MNKPVSHWTRIAASDALRFVSRKIDGVTSRFLGDSLFSGRRPVDRIIDYPAAKLWTLAERVRGNDGSPWRRLRHPFIMKAGVPIGLIHIDDEVVLRDYLTSKVEEKT